MKCRKAKVSQFDFHLVNIIDQYIFRLYISVHDIVGMQIVDGQKQLLYYLYHVKLWYLSFVDDEVIELTMTNELTDNAIELVIMKQFINPDNIWVWSLLEDLKLTVH